jgi:predicted acetyltransferase
MATEIRACRPEEMDAYHRIGSYVFANQDGFDEESTATAPDWTTCAFVDGEMVATMGTYPFTVRLNGAPVHMGGVTAVGTLPAWRRKGLLRQIMREGLSLCRDRGQSLAILYASMGAIYQRFGYGLATTMVTYQFDPRYAAFASPAEVGGSVRMETPEDAYPVMKRLYVEYATPRNMFIHRAVPLWQIGILRPRPKGTPVYAAVYRDAQGEPRGHVVYQTREDPALASGPNQRMEVRDFIALDMESYRALWEYIRRHDLVGQVVMRGCLGVDDPAPDLLLEPRMLERRTQDGVWMRVVDVQTALSARPYGDRGELTISVPADDMCPWNVGSYLLETDGPTAEVSRRERPADLVVDSNALASLLSGHNTATQLWRAGKLEAADAATALRADRIFRTDHAPHCPNQF